MSTGRRKRGRGQANLDRRTIESASTHRRIRTHRRKMARHEVEPPVWAKTMALKNAGRLPISPETFARKVQKLIDASLEEKEATFRITQRADVRELMLEVLSDYHTFSNWVGRLKKIK